jgi:hypothetical protein
MPFAIDLKHDTQQRAWRRLSIVTISPDPLVEDLVAHIGQYARDHQMNPHQIAGRLVDIESSQIGSNASNFKRIVLTRESNAMANRATGGTDEQWAVERPRMGT